MNHVGTASQSPTQASLPRRIAVFERTPSVASAASFALRPRVLRVMLGATPALDPATVPGGDVPSYYLLSQGRGDPHPSPSTKGRRGSIPSLPVYNLRMPDSGLSRRAPSAPMRFAAAAKELYIAHNERRIKRAKRFPDYAFGRRDMPGVDVRQRHADGTRSGRCRTR